MPFLLARGKPNLAVEVQRWQYFLRVKRGISEVGRLDADFGGNTERATRIYQASRGLEQTGALDQPTLAAARADGYTVLPDDHYDRLAAAGPPKRPTNLNPPSHAQRNQHLGCFEFVQPPRPQRHDPDGILIGRACDGSTSDWEADNIARVAIPELANHPAVSSTTFRFHRKAEARVVKLFRAWGEADLLHLILTWDGSFNARYKRTKAGSPPGGHGVKASRDVPALSNHAFGSAFDIAASQNPFDRPSAPYGAKGCVMELVPLANAHGFFWGGHFNDPEDGMHFELADFT